MFRETEIFDPDLETKPMVEYSKLKQSDRKHYDELGEIGNIDVNYVIAPDRIKDYKIIKVLGEGSFGSAMLAKIKKTGQLVVIKKAMNEEGVRLNEAEFRVLYRVSPLCAKYLVCVRGFIRDRDVNYIVLDYVKGSISLYDFIYRSIGKDQEGRTFSRCMLMTSAMRFMVCYRLIKGLYALHSAGVVHRDIKPDNIIINREMDVRYIDYGLSCEDNVEAEKRLNKLEKYHGNINRTEWDKKRQKLIEIIEFNKKCVKKYVGTPVYMPPLNFRVEQTFEDLKAADIYSLGLTIYMLILCTVRSFIRQEYMKGLTESNFTFDVLMKIMKKYKQMAENTFKANIIDNTRYILFNKLVYRMCKYYKEIDLKKYIDVVLPDIANTICRVVYGIKPVSREMAILTLKGQAAKDLQKLNWTWPDD